MKHKLFALVIALILGVFFVYSTVESAPKNLMDQEFKPDYGSLSGAN